MDLTLLVGTQIGDYHLKKLLGRGGMGAVFLGWHMHMQLPFAVKVLRPDLADNERYLKRFFHEAHQGARLKHENIVTIHNAGLADVNVAGAPPQLPFLAMEYVEGKDIYKVMKGQPKRRLQPSHAVEVVMQALRGLSYAHGEGMIHRDIKPENLLLTPANVVRIADFGLARGLDGPADPLEHGSVMGTPEYMPIEQWQAREDIDHRVDIYAMGASLYHMLAGTPPFPGRTPIAILRLVRAGQSQAIELVAPEVDVMLSGVVQKMMGREPGDRHQTAQAALDDLAYWRRLYEEGTLPGMRVASRHAAGFDLDEIEAGANEILQGDVPALLPADEEAALGVSLVTEDDDDDDDEAVDARVGVIGGGKKKPQKPSKPTKPSVSGRGKPVKLEFADDDDDLPEPAPQPVPRSPAPSSPTGRKNSRRNSPANSSKPAVGGNRRGSSRPPGVAPGRPASGVARPTSGIASGGDGRGKTFAEMPHLHGPRHVRRNVDVGRLISLVLVIALLAGGLFVLRKFGCDASGQAPPESTGSPVSPGHP
ncbi:MAG: serine/threonine protein kinase [Planctomycetota bacterium]